jgi:hypothetical protein
MYSIRSGIFSSQLSDRVKKVPFPPLDIHLSRWNGGLWADVELPEDGASLR